MRARQRAFVYGAIVLGIVFAIVQHLKADPDWQAFSRHEFFAHLTQVRLTYILAAVSLQLASFGIRALRWHELLYPLQRTSFGNRISSIFVGYAAMSLLGRGAELSRPMLFSRKEQLPFPRVLSTVVVEHMFDSIAILTFFLASLPFLKLAEGLSFQSRTVFHLFSSAAMVVLGILLCLTAVIFHFQATALQWADSLFGWMRFLAEDLRLRTGRWLKSFVDGLAFLHHPRALALSGFYSVGMWLVLITSTLLFIQSFKIPISFSQAVLMTAFAAMGTLIDVPGVGGGPQALTLYSLSSFLGVKPEACSAVALLGWGIARIMPVIIGLFVFLLERASFRERREIAIDDIKAGPADPPTLQHGN